MSGAPDLFLRRIVIVGGGSAGWMTAAALSSLLDPKQVRITLVESEAIGTIGVGEATIPDILNFNRLLGIPEAEFMRAAQATFKLGIEFVDWKKQGRSYFHPFGQHGVDMQGIDFHQYWLFSHAHGNPARIQDYSLCAQAASRNRFALPDPNPDSVMSHIRYAYHLDATRYAQFLRVYAGKRGVKRIGEKVDLVNLDGESGFIKSVRLENGTAVHGDMFFDCTGFRALLIEKALGVGFHDWSHWLPCDSAQAVATEHSGPLLPYTVAAAKSAGWQWRIPTQTRTGNGYIYASDLMSDKDATDNLLAGLDGPTITDPGQLRFRTGCRKTFWYKNCVAIGLSAGFLEPLESTSIFLIQEGISKFISLFPNADFPPVVTEEYNRQLGLKFEQVRDFIILHYKATERDDSAFWNYCRNMAIPDRLTHKIELFREAGRVFRYEDELFSTSSWVAVMLGQGITPKTCDPIVSTLPRRQVDSSLISMRRAVTRAAETLPTHAQFIQKYCPAAA
ncbi:MAG: tryptophan 7-halogenase [Hyphomonadaceae bacterium]|nr:tryptophan 7-halogenase [Hyphomonadaceae bacterium]